MECQTFNFNDITHCELIWAIVPYQKALYKKQPCWLFTCNIPHCFSWKPPPRCLALSYFWEEIVGSREGESNSMRGKLCWIIEELWNIIRTFFEQEAVFYNVHVHEAVAIGLGANSSHQLLINSDSLPWLMRWRFFMLLLSNVAH